MNSSMLKFILYVCFQEGRRPGRRAFGVVFALCSWMVSPWTWRRERRSPRGFRRDVQATAAATAHSARIRVAVLRDPTAFPATVAHLLTLEPSATEVHSLCHQSTAAGAIMETHCRNSHVQIITKWLTRQLKKCTTFTYPVMVCVLVNSVTVWWSRFVFSSSPSLKSLMKRVALQSSVNSTISSFVSWTNKVSMLKCNLTHIHLEIQGGTIHSETNTLESWRDTRLNNDTHIYYM